MCRLSIYSDCCVAGCDNRRHQLTFDYSTWHCTVLAHCSSVHWYIQSRVCLYVWAVRSVKTNQQKMRRMVLLSCWSVTASSSSFVFFMFKLVFIVHCPYCCVHLVNSVLCSVQWLSLLSQASVEATTASLGGHVMNGPADCVYVFTVHSWRSHGQDLGLLMESERTLGYLLCIRRQHNASVANGTWFSSSIVFSSVIFVYCTLLGPTIDFQQPEISHCKVVEKGT